MSEELKRKNPADAEGMDPMLQEALRDFRGSVRAWSDAAYNRPRPVLASVPHPRAWRRSAAWVLSLALSLGIVGTAGYEHHHRAVLAQAQHRQQEIERQRILAQEREKEAEELMANIDSDVSRQVPAAMEPLAALMTDDSR